MRSMMIETLKSLPRKVETKKVSEKKKVKTKGKISKFVSEKKPASLKSKGYDYGIDEDGVYFSMDFDKIAEKFARFGQERQPLPDEEV